MKRIDIPDPVFRALMHVRCAHPEVTQVVLTSDQRWHFMDDHFQAPPFSDKVSVSFLEDMMDDVRIVLPSVYEWPEDADGVTEQEILRTNGYKLLERMPCSLDGADGCAGLPFTMERWAGRLNLLLISGEGVGSGAYLDVSEDYLARIKQAEKDRTS